MKTVLLYRKIIALVAVMLIASVAVLYGFSALVRMFNAKRPARSRAAAVSRQARAVPPQTRVPVAVEKPAVVAEKPVIKKTPQIQIAFRAKKDCYVRLKKDGVVVFDGIIPRGTIETWSAQKEIEASINDSSAVEIEANGELLSLGKTRRAIKSLKITPNSVTIH